MASSARIFFAGIGTTFIIIGAGFGAGLIFANSAVHNVPAQTRASSPLVDPVRVILPTTAEAAEAPPPRAAVSQPVSAPEIKVPEKQVEKVDTRKAEIEQRERKKHSEERKARKIAAARAKRQMDAKQQLEQQHSPQPGIMAFDGDAPRQVSLFGN
jgi:type IV secretory pathway VirB10-like protein